MFSYYGSCPNAKESLILFEAVKLGLIPAISDRLSEEERKEIVSGAIYIWDERKSPMRRWTDGRTWSNSRVVGDFLEYRESIPDEKNGQYCIKPYGLRKRSICLPSHKGSSLRLIAYFSSIDIKRGILKTPSCDPMFAGIVQKMDENPSEQLSLQSLVSMKRRKRSKSMGSETSKLDKFGCDSRHRPNVAIAPAPPRADDFVNKHGLIDHPSPKSEHENLEFQDFKPHTVVKESKQPHSPPVLVLPQIPQPQFVRSQFPQMPQTHFAQSQLVQPPFTSFVQSSFVQPHSPITPIHSSSHSVFDPPPAVSASVQESPNCQILGNQTQNSFSTGSTPLAPQSLPSLQNTSVLPKHAESLKSAARDVLPTFISTPPNEAIVLPSPVWRPLMMHSEDRRALGLLDSLTKPMRETK